MLIYEGFPISPGTLQPFPNLHVQPLPVDRISETTDLHRLECDFVWNWRAIQSISTFCKELHSDSSIFAIIGIAPGIWM